MQYLQRSSKVMGLTFKYLIFIFLTWRLILFVPLIAGFYIIPFREGYEFASIWYRIVPSFPVSNFYLYPCANFDGVHYLSIAGNGYIDEGRFFPLSPISINLVSKIFGGGKPFGLTQFFVGLGI